SNIQPYGTPNGTKFANKNGNDIGTSSPANSNGEISPQKAKNTEYDFSVQAALEMAESRQELNKEEREKLVAQMNEFVTSINKGV
ncbi:hypothetical protein OFP26_37360, partial [Escherichia coli]|nr:hypothetical protein [Escherichia coli]